MVTHREHGVGRARGLATLTIDGEKADFFELEYAGSQRLFLPIDELHLLERHHGGAELSKMGGKAWRNARARAEKRAFDTAAHLLDLNARRAAAKPVGQKTDEEKLARFVSAFAFVSTPDQESAAAATLDDLRAAKRMDRLVTADVGFGKTEIAMRAAALCAFAGGQTAVLAPTTLLAQQHGGTFADRFAGFNARVETLTRLTPADERRRILAELAAGKTNILIGTHALLSPTVAFADLRLAIIDEEHRFGVRHKEAFKNMRAEVDILSLSATPIPRTLAMSFEGLRDLSVIATPPAGRLAIKTQVAPFSRVVVAEACERELMRGGQIFFVHNDIRGLEGMAEKLRRWLPRARVAMAHGGMAASALQGVMRSFLRHDADILLCTTIVESGLDVANANTLLVTRADKMGLSRLHQLRGRVGRAGAQAFAYFLTPEGGDLGRAAKARLASLENYGALGGGFFLAMRDLEIRGAGEILGDKQSGEMEAVGCAMYRRMVRAAARRLRGLPHVEEKARVELPQPALLPQSYIPAAGERLHYYRRLAAAQLAAEVDEIEAEWQDRFGKPPPPALLLAQSHRLRALAVVAGVVRLRVAAGVATLHCAPKPACGERLIALTAAGVCRLAANNAVSLPLAGEGLPAQLAQLEDFLRQLAAPASA